MLRTQKELFKAFDREATPEELAEEMQLSSHRVRAILKMAQVPISLQATVGDSDDCCFGEVKRGSKWGFIGTNAQEVVAFQFDAVRSFSEGLAGVSIQGDWGFINKQGKLQIQLKFAQVMPFSKGYAGARLTDSNWGDQARASLGNTPKADGHARASRMDPMVAALRSSWRVLGSWWPLAQALD